MDNTDVRTDAGKIIKAAIAAVLPDEAVRRALSGRTFGKPVTVFAIGKAAWRMARAAQAVLGEKNIRQGLVITKYGHSEGAIDGMEIMESGHPVPDENSERAARRALAIAQELTNEDTAILLISGGGSALFECPTDGVTMADIADVTQQLLQCGADITEINCIRKRLSAVKGGRFALCAAPAKMLCILLSDVLGDAPDVIASGPAYPDNSTCENTQSIAKKYHLQLSPACSAALNVETPKSLPHVETMMAGNVSLLCAAAAKAAQALGYHAQIKNTSLSCEARDAGQLLAEEAQRTQSPCAVICGGETVVHVRGKGKGGRNQEVALSASIGIAGMKNTCVIALGSDGTDGPTDAAGGLVTGDFCARAGLDKIKAALDNNDAYPLLKSQDALIMTGPTGTNVNDLYMVIKK